MAAGVGAFAVDAVLSYAAAVADEAAAKQEAGSRRRLEIEKLRSSAAGLRQTIGQVRRRPLLTLDPLPSTLRYPPHLPFPFQLTHTRTHAHTHTRTRIHAYTHTRIHAPPLPHTHML